MTLPKEVHVLTDTAERLNQTAMPEPRVDTDSDLLIGARRLLFSWAMQGRVEG